MDQTITPVASPPPAGSRLGLRARLRQVLIERHPDQADTLRHAAAAAGRGVERLGYLPWLARRTDWIALVDLDSGRIVGHAPVDGF